jgi:hypothetical protein
MPSHQPHPTATVAGRAATAGGRAAMFNVTHFGRGVDATEAAAPVIDIVQPEDGDQVATDVLAVQLAGVGFQVHTWKPDTPRTTFATASTTRISVSPWLGRHRTGMALYRGSVVINPGVRNDPAQGMEILLTIGYEPWRPDFADSLMIALAYHGLAEAAKDNGMPILYLHSPAAPFRDPPASFRGDGSGEAPRISNGMALRMLVGLDGHDPNSRLALLRNVADLAAANGFGLQVSDRRLGRVRGQWWSMLPPDAGRCARRKAELFGWAPAGVPGSVRLVTVVGPARVGSSAAIATELVVRNVGVLAVAEVLLQETAFINLLVPIAPARIADGPVSGTALPIAEGIGQVASDCGLTRRQEVRFRTWIRDTPATDYQLLSTGPVGPGIEPSGGSGGRWWDPGGHPIWVSWSLPLEPDPGLRPPDVAGLVVAQLQEATDRVEVCRIEYYRAKVSPDDRIRGRAKISVALRQVSRFNFALLLSELCSWVQQEVESTLVREHVPLSAIQLRVAWRERWLNRKNLVM